MITNNERSSSSTDVPKREVPEVPELQLSTKRFKHDESDVACVTFEELLIHNVDLAEVEETMLAEAHDDEHWLWMEPDVTLKEKSFDPQELHEARKEEVEMLTDFQAYQWVKEDQAIDGRWIKSRFEDI